MIKIIKTYEEKEREHTGACQHCHSEISACVSDGTYGQSGSILDGGFCWINLDCPVCGKGMTIYLPNYEMTPTNYSKIKKEN